DARQQHTGIGGQRASLAQGRHPRGYGPGMQPYAVEVIQVGAGVDHPPHHHPDRRRKMMAPHLGLDAAKALRLDLFGYPRPPAHIFSLKARQWSTRWRATSGLLPKWRCT